MNAITENEIKQEMAKYKPEQLELYLAEAGWQEWMEDYTEAEDGQPITESEHKEIDEILLNLWLEVHEEDE